jgi:dCMP deaminase
MQSTESSLLDVDKRKVVLVHSSAHDAADCKHSLYDAATDAYTPAKRVKLPPEATVDTHDSSSKTMDRFITPMPAAAPTTTMMPSSTPSSLSKNEIQSLLWKEAAYDANATNTSTDDSSQQKRRDYISWDEYFMAVAALSAHRSKDPASPSGACIVDARNRIIGIGYSGFPRGCSDDCLPWKTTTTTAAAADSKDDNDSTLASVPSWLHTPTPYKVHAEVNAILNKCSADVAGSRLYTDHFPCNECAKVLVQSRIAQVVYRVDPDFASDSSRASRILFKMAGVQVRQYQPEKHHLDLDFAKSTTTVATAAATAATTAATTVPTNNASCSCPNHHHGQALAKAPVQDDQQQQQVQEAIRYRDLLMQEAGYDPVLTGSTKRTDYLSWDDYFMAVTLLTAQRSKDPNTQVGACIVDKNKRIVGLGYNGFPAGCSDDDLPWARQGESELHKKYLYVCHAEVNAILNKCSADVKGAVLYVALFPCNNCAKMIIQAGIREVVYMSDQYHDSDACRASRIMFKMAGVSLRHYIPTMASVRIQLDDDDNVDATN